MNIISEWFLEAANHTCGPFDPDVDEMALAGLTPVSPRSATPQNLLQCRTAATGELCPVGLALTHVDVFPAAARYTVPSPVSRLP